MKNRSKKWTKRELKIYSEGEIELAKAVIRQWHEDGKPECDKEAITYWFNIIKQCEDFK